MTPARGRPRDRCSRSFFLLNFYNLWLLLVLLLLLLLLLLYMCVGGVWVVFICVGVELGRGEGIDFLFCFGFDGVVIMFYVWRWVGIRILSVLLFTLGGRSARLTYVDSLPVKIMLRRWSRPRAARPGKSSFVCVFNFRVDFERHACICVCILYSTVVVTCDRIIA